MASHALNTSRRGLLGFFAAAIPAYVVATPTIASIATPAESWQTKPVAQWTHEDRIAEARFQIHAISKRIDGLRQEPKSKQRDFRIHIVTGTREWWQTHLATLIA